MSYFEDPIVIDKAGDVGLVFMSQFVRAKENLQFRIEFMFSKFDEEVIDGLYGYKYSGLNVTMPFTLQYLYPLNRFSPYVNGGYVLFMNNMKQTLDSVDSY